MRLTDDLPKWLALLLRLLLYTFVMFILFNIFLGFVKGRLMNNTVECSGISSSSLGGLTHAKSMVACLRNKNGFFENLLMRPVYRAIDALPSTPKELVGVWDASQPRCNYRHTLKENGEFISEPRGCSLSSDTYHGVWGTYDNQFVWLANEGVVWPPDINPIDVVDKDFFLLVEQDGSRTKFSRVTNAVPVPAENERAEGSGNESAPDVEAVNTNEVAMSYNLGFSPELRDPHTAQEWMTLGHWYLHESGSSGVDKAKARTAAANAYSKVIEAEPDNANAWFNRGLANGGINDIDKAIELDPNRFHFLMTRGSLADLRKALALDPVLWGMYWRWRDQRLSWWVTGRAADDYIKAIMREPKNMGIYFNPYTFGSFGEKEGAYRRRVDDLTDLIKRNPREAEFYDSLGGEYFKHGAYTDALAAFCNVVELTQSADAYHSRGIVYTALKQWGNAKKDFETALAKEDEYARKDMDWFLFLSTPDGAERWVNYGNALGGWVPSIVAYTKALEFDPKNIAALRGRAEASSKSDLPNQAIEDYSVLLRLAPLNAKETLFRRGEIYSMTGELENAINDWEMAAGLGNEEAKRRAAEALDGFVATIMGWYEGDGSEEPLLGADGRPLNEQEKQQKAIEALNRALKIFPDHPPSLRMRATQYAQSGKNKLALDDFSKAIRLAPKDAEAYMGRAGIYRAMQDEKSAIADWKKADELGNEDAHWLLQENGGK